MGSAQRSVASGARRVATHPPESRDLRPGCSAWRSELGCEAKVR
jgi:hypothetical protein